MKLAIIHETSPGNSTTPEMDRKIWGELPVEILERILSLLPPKTFISLRSTCKHFHSLIFSPLFISKPSPFSAYILLSHPQSNNYLLYDTVLNTWRDIILPFAPLLTTATSLLCFSAVPDSSNSTFFIYNLLARSSRIVKFPEFPFAFEFPTVIINSNGYKLFCLSSGPNMSAYVYDSSARDWTRYQGFQRTIGYTTYHQQGVHYNGSLYFATCEPFLVVRFNLSTGSWDPCEADLTDELTFVRLVSGNGNRLFMFGGIGTFGISTSMKVWELDPNGRNWNEIEMLEEELGIGCLNALLYPTIGVMVSSGFRLYPCSMVTFN
ncbi:F-box/kelch-repeat protein [Tanacetum coccineum]